MDCLDAVVPRRFLLSAIARNATKSWSVTVSPSDSSSEELSTANLPRTMGRPRSGDFLRSAAAFLPAPFMRAVRLASEWASLSEVASARARTAANPFRNQYWKMACSREMGGGRGAGRAGGIITQTRDHYASHPR